MSGLMHKVKDALSGDKSNTSNTTGTGLKNEHGTQSGVHDTPIGGSVAHGSSTSATNPGILHSTKPGIHGDRDAGISSSGFSNQEFAGQSGTTGVSKTSGSVAHGDSMPSSNQGVLHSTQPGIHGARHAGSGYDDTTTGLGGATGNGYDNATRDTGVIGGDSGMRAGPQYTGSRKHDAGLVQSGVDSIGRDTGVAGGYDAGRSQGLTGSGYDDTRDTGLTGGGVTGSGNGYNNSRDIPGGTGAGLTDDRAGYDSGVTGGGHTGSGFDDSTRGTGIAGTGSGLTGDQFGYDSGTTRDRSGLTGSGTGVGSDMSGNTSSGTSLRGEANRLVGGSRKHHPGDGHPEDILHPGPHQTMTAKALDPHLNP